MQKCALKLAVSGLLLIGNWQVSAIAAPINLISNGSFEDGLTGWTHSGTFIPTANATTPALAVLYNSTAPYPISAYGELVAPPTDATASPDAAGVRGAYFVDDGAVNESLSQFVLLTPGTYRIGFDVYAPNNGYSNFYDARFSAQIAGMTLANYMVSSEPATTWMNFSGLATISTAGMYSASFLFNTPGLGVAKDVIVDRVFIVATAADGSPLPIPEPQTLLLLGVAAVGMALALRQRNPKRVSTTRAFETRAPRLLAQ